LAYRTQGYFAEKSNQIQLTKNKKTLQFSRAKNNSKMTMSLIGVNFKNQ
tara:strand:- start:1601 stop:1747 length:147 start_codon:yes stop_codon:yes gene_type:complete